VDLGASTVDATRAPSQRTAHARAGTLGCMSEASRGEPAIRTVAMPHDTNPAGDIFGGWLMAQMDLAAGTIAARHAQGRCATIAVDAMEFHRPVHVGDEVSLYGRLVSVGRTSMKIQVEAYRRARTSDVRERVTDATFVYVALDEHGDKRALPPVALDALTPG
jgi:acyl-CoA thioesterase YciA